MAQTNGNERFPGQTVLMLSVALEKLQAIDLLPLNAPGFGYTRSLAGFVTTMCGFRFSVHTTCAIIQCVARPRLRLLCLACVSRFECAHPPDEKSPATLHQRLCRRG